MYFDIILEIYGGHMLDNIRTLRKGKLIVNYKNYEDSNILREFIDKIAYKFEDIKDYFSVEYDSLELTLYSKTDFDEFVANTTSQYGTKDNIPNWLVGFSINKGIHIVIPTADRLEYMAKVAIHELVHLLSYKIEHKEKRVKLLDEGIACFLANQMSEKRFKTIIQDYNQNNLHKIEDFCIYNGNEFGKLNGYAYSYVIMEFLNLKFGKEKILYWLKYPEEFIKVVPTIETNFRGYLINKITK